VIFGELEDSIVGWPLLFGMIGYCVIIVFLTFWLTKYHIDCGRIAEEKGYSKEEEDYFQGNFITTEVISAKDFRITPSTGESSTSKKDQGGVLKE